MSGNPKFMSFVVSLLFGGAIVALGAKELNKRFEGAEHGATDAAKLVQEILADPSMMLAEREDVDKAAPKTGARRVLPKDEVENEDEEGSTFNALLNKMLP